MMGIRLEGIKRYIKVCFVGVAGTIVQLVFFNILRHHGSPTQANAIAVELAIITNFFMNHFFTFKDRLQHRGHGVFKLFRKLLKFNAFSLLSLILQVIVMHVGSKFFSTTALALNIYVIVGIVLGSVTNFFFYNRFIWKDHSPKDVF